MKINLEIITVTKDDLEGVIGSIKSTRASRANNNVKQIIIDSSAVETGNKIIKFIESEPNVTYAWQAPSGIASAFNLGLSMAKSEWVWFLNGRDETHPDLDIDNFMYLLNASKADAIIFELEFMQSRTRYKHPPMWNLWPPVFNWIPHPATIVRRKLFEQYGTFNNTFKIAMDYDLWFRLFSAEVIVDMISIPIAVYDESGLSSTNNRCLAEEGKKVVRTNMRLLLNKWLHSGISIYAAWKHFNKMIRSG